MRAGIALAAGRCHRGLVPRGDDGFDLPVAGQPLNTIVVGQLERLKPAQNIGGLPDHQPEVAPVDRNFFELQYRTALDRKSTRLNSSHSQISYAVFCLKKKKITRKNK